MCAVYRFIEAYRCEEFEINNRGVVNEDGLWFGEWKHWQVREMLSVLHHWLPDVSLDNPRLVYEAIGLARSSLKKGSPNT